MQGSAPPPLLLVALGQASAWGCESGHWGVCKAARLALA